MNRAETRWNVGLACSSVDADVTEVVALLRRAAGALDQMWHEAAFAAPHAVMGLGEASHSVHRALIALNQPEGLEARLEISHVDTVGAALSA